MDAFFERGPVRVRGEYLDLAHSLGPVPGCAFVVPKKVAPKAVDRNRLRRRARAILSRVLSDLPLPIQLVFSARKAALAADFQSLEREIKILVDRAIVSYNGPI